MSPELATPSERRRRRRAAVLRLAVEQGGVVTRSQLYAAGYSRGEVRANVRAERWAVLGWHCLRVQTGTMSVQATWWAAVLEAGPRAFLDGETALMAAGLEHYTADQIRVSVPKGARVRQRGTRCNIRETRRWRSDDVVLDSGVPRAKPAVASVRAALWARSNRQAALLLTMPVQQGLTRVEDIAAEMLRIRRDRRRAYLNSVVLDLAGGVRSLGELDVLRGCRERGIPEPDEQVLRRTQAGTYYLDFRWQRWRVVVEVDGIQHSWVENVVADAIRQNSIVLSGDSVLRLPVLGLRVCPDVFFEQIADALRRAGCPLPDRPAA